MQKLMLVLRYVEVQNSKKSKDKNTYSASLYWIYGLLKKLVLKRAGLILGRRFLGFLRIKELVLTLGKIWKRG